MPAMPTLPAVLLARAQEAPDRVIVTVVPEVEPDPVQLVNPLGSVIAGDAGTVKLLLKTTVTVSPAARAPALLVVKPAVQVAVDPASVVEPLKLTLVTLVVPVVAVTLVGEAWRLGTASSATT